MKIFHWNITVLIDEVYFFIEINFHINNIYGYVAQSVEWWPVEQEISGLILASGKNFKNDISFTWGNEPNGEQQEQQLK